VIAVSPHWNRPRTGEEPAPSPGPAPRVNHAYRTQDPIHVIRSAPISETLGGRHVARHHDKALGRVIFSAAEESYPLAVRELQDEFGRDANIERVGPDTGVLIRSGLTAAEVARQCRRRPIVFVKHLTAEVARLAAGADLSLAEVGAAAADAAAARVGPGATLAVQVWPSGNAEPAGTGLRPGAVATAIVDALRARGLSAARAGQDEVLSCCLADRTILIGLNRAVDSIADWPGGRVRLGRAEEQISRSEFKLEELLQSGAVELPAEGMAVDLGAAPGGWTRILRQAGMRVTAVDPGDLDPRLARDPRVTHVRTTAMEFLRGNPRPYNVVVNDMRMDPELSAQAMVDAARRLAPGGIGVITLKTGSHRVLETIDRCLGTLRGAYEIDLVRQLQHNRNEVTAVLHRR